MKKIILSIVIFLALVSFAIACKSTKDCPAYGQNSSIEEVQNV